MSRAKLREIWEARVADFRASGQSASAWCSEHAINLHTLRYWLKKMSQGSNRLESITPVKWLSVEVAEDISASPVPGGGIVIRLGDARIEVDPGCNLILLREVVQTLATLC